MKASQRYRLNRLAETLVTPARFAGDFDFPLVAVRTLSDTDRADLGFGYPRPDDTGCPFGDPNCPNPGRAQGFGFHAFCAEQAYPGMHRLVDILDPSTSNRKD